MPSKLNLDRRRHIPKQKHRVANWPAHNATLRRPLRHIVNDGKSWRSGWTGSR
jgi:hypothetical protein